MFAAAFFNDDLDLSTDPAELNAIFGTCVGALNASPDLSGNSAFHLVDVDVSSEVSIIRPFDEFASSFDTDTLLLQDLGQWVVLWKFRNTWWSLLAKGKLLQSEVVQSDNTFVVFTLRISTFDTDLQFHKSDTTI